MKDNRRKAGSKATCFPVSLLVLRGIHSALDPYQGLCTGDGVANMQWPYYSLLQ